MSSYAYIPVHDLRMYVVKRTEQSGVLLLMRSHLLKIQFIHPRLFFAERALHLSNERSEFGAEIRILTAR